MEEESWICVEESFSSDEEFSDSDKVDSETEAELYSLIHFEGNLSNLNCQSSATKNDTESDATFLLSDKMNNALHTEKDHNGKTEFAGNSNNFLQNITELKTVGNFDKTVSNNTLQKTLQENIELFLTDHKEPTNFVNNSNHLAGTQSLNDSTKRKFDDSESIYSSPSKKVATDSETEIIWPNVDSSGNKDIQTNICEDDDIIFVSSDSETDNFMPSKKISSNHNMSMPNIKVGESPKDLWFVNQEDTSRGRNIKSRRYHDKVDITCSNCDRKGHHNRMCPLPKSIKCFICGGEHLGITCTNRICGKCYGTGHDRKSCWKSQVYYCGLCNMHGHTKENCPDLWRRYHLTTQHGKIVPDKKVKNNSYVFCCKCGRPGHYGAVCNFEINGYKNCLPTWPNVLSYDEPYNIPVQTSNNTGNKQNMKKKDLVMRRKKKILTEAEILARKERIKKRKQERKQLKHQKLLNSNAVRKVKKEKDFPRTPKNNSSVNLSIPRTPKNNSTVNLSSPRTPKNNSTNNLSCPRAQKNNSTINLSSPRAPKNNSTINLSSPRSQKNNYANNPLNTRIFKDEVVILPTPKIKKNISFVDLTSPKTPKKNTVIGLIPPKTPKNNCALKDSDDLPESVRLLMLSEARRKEKNRKRRLKRRQNRLKEREQIQNMIT